MVDKKNNEKIHQNSHKVSSSCPVYLRDGRGDPLMNDLPLINANEGNVDLVNLSKC